jgi:hypothetical protein
MAKIASIVFLLPAFNDRIEKFLLSSLVEII